MGLQDWNWRLPADPQDYPWDCAACSTAWALRTVGLDYSEQDVINGLGSSRITPTYGLMDASGAGLVEYLAEIGVLAENEPSASWSDVVGAAGHQPMVIGGRAWCHWVGVRMSGLTTGHAEVDALALMNSASGWCGIDQVLHPYDFEQLGPFSAVWFTAW